MQERAKSSKTALQILEEATKTYAERNALYGDNYYRAGDIFMALFPDGVELRTPDEFCRFCIIVHDVTKSMRYCQNFKEGGHLDSAHDKIVYNAIQEELTRAKMGKS